MNVLGFLDINNSKLFSYTTYDRVDSDVVISIFDQFVEQIKQNTIVVLDNASIHRSKKFKAKLDDWKQKGLTIFYLPPYSPQLNPIEILWKFMKYYWIEFDAYESIGKMRDYVEKVLDGYGDLYEISFG